jgi:hypothetical protein
MSAGPSRGSSSPNSFPAKPWAIPDSFVYDEPANPDPRVSPSSEIMAKRPLQATDGSHLFVHQEQAHARRIRRQRALFIPRYLEAAAADRQLSGPAQDRAHAIAVRWADLESSGDLAKHKETSIDTQFLDQLFGEGLDYQVKTNSPAAWQLEPRRSMQ